MGAKDKQKIGPGTGWNSTPGKKRSMQVISPARCANRSDFLGKPIKR